MFIAICCPSVPCHCHLLRLPVMPYWQILPLPAMPCLQQEQVCYQHLLLSPLPPHIILHQQTAGGSKQSVRRPTNSFYRSKFSCFSSQDGDMKVQVPVWPGLVVISWEEEEDRVSLLLWGGELCYSPRIQTWELSWGQLCSQSSCEVVAKSYIKRVLQNQLWRWQMFTFQTCVTTCDNVSKVQFSELQCFISVTRREVQCWDIHPENIQSWMWQCGKS